VFKAAEKEMLRPLPTGPQVLATWLTVKIGPDIIWSTVLYSGAYLTSALCGLFNIGKTEVRLTATMVHLFICGHLGKTHMRKALGEQTDFGDYPLKRSYSHEEPGLVPSPGRRAWALPRDPAKSFMRSEAALASAAGRGRGGGWRRRC
jgi:hypothetical protein